MKVKNFYIELEESVMLADFVKDTEEVEHCIDAIVTLNTEITNFKFCIKNGGFEKAIKKADKNANVTIAEVKDMIKNKERDLIANLKFLESATKIERVKIIGWLNFKYLENFSYYNESTTVLSLAREINKIMDAKRNYSL